MISYDTPAVARVKSRWAMKMGLGGAMFWEISMDKIGSESLVGTVVAEFGHLEESENHLSYPWSKYENLKAGMPDGDVV